RPRALGRVAGATRAAAEAERGGQRVGDRLELRAGALGAPGVVRGGGQLGLLPQLLDPALVLGPCAVVEDLAGIALHAQVPGRRAPAGGVAGRRRAGGELQAVDLLARRGEQAREVVQALEIGQVDRL